MLKRRKQAFEAIQPLFRAAEASTDRAAADSARCIAEMLRVRADANLPLATGTDILDKLVLALTANVSARKLFIEAHALTPEVLKAIGLERIFGDGLPCPPSNYESGHADIVPIRPAA